MGSDRLAIRARVGLIIPSSNRLTEPQFHRYAPSGVQYHVTRLRMTGPHHVPLPDLVPRIVEAAQMLGDAKCDLVVFHCTSSSMQAGLAAEQQVVEAIQRATGRPAITTASAAVEAFRALEARRLALVTPYPQEVNEREIAFLAEAGLEVIRDRALGLGGSDAYFAAPPSLWAQVTREEADPRADAYFLSCTAIDTIDIIEELELILGRPVVTSNQAAIWCSLRTCGVEDRVPGLGRLLRLESPARAPA